jgi:hypothetical protein
LKELPGSAIVLQKHQKKRKKKEQFTPCVKAKVQLKSSIPIGGKVEISLIGFLHLGVKTEIEKNIFNLPQVTNKC